MLHLLLAQNGRATFRAAPATGQFAIQRKAMQKNKAMMKKGRVLAVLQSGNAWQLAAAASPTFTNTP
jgi:hypothetical protein